MYNLMEDLVRIGVDEVLAAGRETVCSCSQCHLEMVAYALNQLPPRYVVSGFMKSELKKYAACSQLYSDVAAAVTKAVGSLQKKIVS
jgi:competence protein ComFB